MGQRVQIGSSRPVSEGWRPQCASDVVAAHCADHGIVPHVELVTRTGRHAMAGGMDSADVPCTPPWAIGRGATRRAAAPGAEAGHVARPTLRRARRCGQNFFDETEWPLGLGALELQGAHAVNTAFVEHMAAEVLRMFAWGSMRGKPWAAGNGSAQGLGLSQVTINCAMSCVARAIQAQVPATVFGGFADNAKGWGHVGSACTEGAQRVQ